MSGKDVATTATIDVAKREAITAKLVEMAATVPGQEGDGLVNIIEQLLAATSVDELDAPWNSAGLERYIGKTIRIDRIQQAESRYRDGVPFYLLAFGVDLATGEVVTFTTSAQAVIVQLLLAHCKGWFPWIVVPSESNEPTEAGYYPQHLKTARAGAPAGDRHARIREATDRVFSERQARRAAGDPVTDGDQPRPVRRAAAEQETEPSF